MVFFGSALLTTSLMAWGRADAADLAYSAIGTWNGKKVYLSPATHSDSGSRGECLFDENDNGYFASYHATNGSYYQDVSNPTSPGRNLRIRGYNVRIGRDSNAVKIANSNAWAATVHIPVHSNARVGAQLNPTLAQCNSRSPLGTKVMWVSSGGKSLSQQFVQWIGEEAGSFGPLRSPGTGDIDCDDKVANPCTSILNLAELTQTNAVASYVELEYHDNTVGAAWMRYDYNKWAWRFGPAIDVYLGYP
jgi:hypothetical protein